MEFRERQFDYKKMEKKDMSSDEEGRRKDFLCWMMEPARRRCEPARRQKKRQTGSMATGTQKMNGEEEPQAMDTSESKRDRPRRENRKYQEHHLRKDGERN